MVRSLRLASLVGFVFCLHKPLFGAGVALSLNAGLLARNEFAVVAWKPALASAVLALVAISLIDVRSSALTDSFAWLMLSGSAAFSNRAFREAGIDSLPVEALLAPVLIWHLVCLWRARKEGRRPKVFAMALAAGTLTTVGSWLPYYVIPRAWWPGWAAVADWVIYFGIVGAGLYAVVRLRRAKVLALYTLAALVLAGLYFGVRNERPRPHSRYALYGSWTGPPILRDESIRQQRDRENSRGARPPEARAEQVRIASQGVDKSAIQQVLRSEHQCSGPGIADGHRS